MVSSLSPFASKGEAIAQLTIGFGAISSSYALIGTLGGNGAVWLLITSLLDGSVQLSLDGVNDWLPILKDSQIPVPCRANFFAITGGTPFYVKKIDTLSTGNLYISAISL